jgi:hypothetical protein
LFVQPFIKAHRLFLLSSIEGNMAVNESTFSLGSIVQVLAIDTTKLLGAVQRPLYGVLQSDGSLALQVAVVSGGGGGSGGGPVAPTAAGTTANTANPVQGVTGGVPMPVSIIGGGGGPVAPTAAGTTANTANPVQGVTGGVPMPVAIVSNSITSNTAVYTAAGTSSTNANPIQGVTGGIAVPVSGTFWQATQPVSLSASVAVTGTFWQTTQPVSLASSVSVTGTFWQATQPISIATMPALVASTAAIGQVGGKTTTVDVTPTISTSAYTAGYVVGGLLTFSNALLTAGTGILQSISLKCKTVQTAGFKLYLFKANPTNSTWTDHAAPAINAADIPFLTAVRTLSSPDSGLGTHTIYVDDGIGKVLNPGATTLYGILVTTGTPTFTSTSDMTISIGILQD